MSAREPESVSRSERTTHPPWQVPSLTPSRVGALMRRSAPHSDHLSHMNPTTSPVNPHSVCLSKAERAGTHPPSQQAIGTGALCPRRTIRINNRSACSVRCAVAGPPVLVQRTRRAHLPPPPPPQSPPPPTNKPVKPHCTPAHTHYTHTINAPAAPARARAPPSAPRSPPATQRWPPPAYRCH